MGKFETVNRLTENVVFLYQVLVHNVNLRCRKITGARKELKLLEL